MAISSPASTTTSLFYSVFPDDGTRAYYRGFPDPVTGKSGTKNYTFEEKKATIENVRGKEETVSLDTTGFQFGKHATKLTPQDFYDDNAIKSKYYPETVEIMKKLTGASRVEIFDHTVRRRKEGVPDAPGSRQPAAQVHVDQTTPASIARVHMHMPAEEVPKLLANRFQIINLWRPIEHPAFDWPLAVCDYRSVKPEDVFPVTLYLPGREGETFSVRHNEEHRWKYLYGMTPEEFVLIKCFDSVQDGSVAVYTPHTSFKDEHTPEGAPPRQSIEIRALVFYD